MSVIEIFRQLSFIIRTEVGVVALGCVMSTKHVLLIGGIVGVSVSVIVLALLWFGVAGVLNVGSTYLMYLFWPSSVMLTTGWRSSIPGMMITISSVAINCLFYMAFANTLRFAVRLVRG